MKKILWNLAKPFFLKIRASIEDDLLVRSVFSAFFRVLMRFKLYFKMVFFAIEKFNLEKLKPYIHLRIGFRILQKYFPHLIDIDYYYRKSFYILDLKHLPFKKNSIEQISIKHFFKYFPNKHTWIKALENWHDKLIPGGIIRLIVYRESKEIRENLPELEKILEKCNYVKKQQTQYSYYNYAERHFLIEFYKKNKSPSHLLEGSERILLRKKLKEISELIGRFGENYFNENETCVIGPKTINLNEKFKKKSYFIKGENFHKFAPERSFHSALIYDTLEYMERNEIYVFLDKLKEILEPESRILLLVPYRNNFFLKSYTQLFSKAILTKIIDESSIEINWINVDKDFRFIICSLINRDPFPRKKGSDRFAVLGNLELRYSQLNSFWDGIARGVLKLGYDPLLLDIKNIPYKLVLRILTEEKIDYLITGDYTAIRFFKKHSDFFRKEDICVCYWYRDLRSPEEINLRNVIDFMFLTNEGQIEDYRKMYQVDNVYYLPQWCNPQFSHPNPFIEEKYDIGFAGQLDKGPFHKERTEVIYKLQEKYNLKVQNAEYNSISEFYSQCKIVFGNDISGHKLFGEDYNGKNYVRLYTSNRLFIAIGCGACYFTNYFPGIEELFEHKKHLVWYKSFEELVKLIDYYLQHDEKRKRIKKRAYNVAKRNHTYVKRIKNALDIIMGNDNKFHGFLKGKTR